MALSAGTRLGPYEVRGALGVGGMGEVYRARDTKLNRDVALKVLPAEVAADPERLSRFRREAQLLAALNHPNIAHIHGLEDEATPPALVMELVEGPTLAELILKRNRLPLGETLAIAHQIANALEAAHSQRIIHRDLKPANIKVRDDGTVKVLDFGIAKVLESATSDDATLTLDTRMGSVIGTPAYMSPEQARGDALDERTDIWAFGCVLYEMATGRRPFPGDSTAQVLATVLEREPDWTPVASTSPTFRRLLGRCLRKDPRRRLRNIADARLDIEDAQAGVDEAGPAVPARSRRGWLGLVTAITVGAAAALAFTWRATPSSGDTRTNVRFDNVTDAVGLEESAAISPDGKMVAFTALDGSRRQLFVRTMAGGVPRQVTFDDFDHEYPRWAPDSTTILYLGSSAPGEQSALNAISFNGGQSRRIAPAVTGGDISHDGQRIAVFQSSGDLIKLVVIRRDGTAVRELVQPVAGRRAERTPRWAPDDQSIAYIDTGSVGFNDAIHIVSADGGEPRTLVSGDIVRGLSWMADGSGLVFGSGLGSTIAYPPTFQLRTIRLAGTDSEQLTYGADSLTDPDVHESGLVLATRTVMRSAIWHVPATGTPAVNMKNARIVTHHTSQAQTPSASPDGKALVYLSDSGGHGNLWVIGTDGEGRRQLTFESDPSVRVAVPVWSPDGSTIVYLKTGGGKSAQWLVNPDGTNPRRLHENAIAAAWSQDSQWLYHVTEGTGGTCIQKIRIADNAVETVRCGNAVRPLPRKDGTLFYVNRFAATGGGFNYEYRKANPENSTDTTLLHRISARQIAYDSAISASATLSPDGNWVALALMDRATTNLWRMSTDNGDLQQVTDFGSRATWIVRQVTWSPDSQFLYAAVADLDADIVAIAGIVGGKGK